MHFNGVQPEEVRSIWPEIEHKVDAAVEYGTSRLTAEDILKNLLTGAMQLWIAWNDSGIRALCITEVAESPRSRWVSVFACTGEGRDEWIGYLKNIEDWARSIGCDCVEMYARPGWKRVLRDYRTRHVQLEKQL